MDFDSKAIAILASSSDPTVWSILLDRSQYHAEVVKRIESAMTPEFSPERAHDIAFHVSDWVAEAASVVALHLAPDRFTDEELRDICERLAIHANHHLMAATALQGQPLQDVFELGLKIEE
ncbi:MAG TPA: hypothetical protein PLX06_08950 [Fimbriimonadaceae bacterium]|nr:hypothetical protein [Fimbriimonadaceae bacterium]